MAIIQRKIEDLPAYTYALKFLHITNIIIDDKYSKLSGKEMEVLAGFLSLDKAITDDYVFNAVARNKVKAMLKISNQGLSFYLTGMIGKGALNRHDISGKISIAKFLIPNEAVTRFMIELSKTDQSGYAEGV